MRSVGTLRRIALDQPPRRLVEDDELALARPDGEAGLGAAQPLDTVAEEAGGVHHDPRLEARRPRWRAARPNPSALGGEAARRR